MKKIIEEIEVYNFEELEKDIQENLIEKEMEYQTEAFCENFFRRRNVKKRIEKLKDRIREMNQELEEFGYNLIENCIDEKNVIEILKEYQFLKNGEIYI